ncbi:MAG TPA: SRPBCC family protein [Candidatus Nitrosotenuis sp.]|jgi:hypothetical protein|nr:SRPBCC family protein [Candidatus Nitrosotenuis sp.]
MTSFEGYGPIPGILWARWRDEGGPRLGAVRDVGKTDGTVHVEEMVVFDLPTRHSARITGLKPPLSLLVREIYDDFVLRPDRDGTRLERTFSTCLTSRLVLPLALALKPLLRRALRRDLRNIKGRMEG